MTRSSGSFQEAITALKSAEYSSDRLSEPFADVFPVTGAAVSTLGDVLGSETVSASDSRAARLDEIQFDLGEGPCWDAMRSARPSVEVDLAERGAERWPAFAAALRSEPIGSIFAFPLGVGALCFGAIDLYSLEPVRLSADHYAQAAAMADVVSRHLLRDALAEDEEIPNPRSRRVVHQATGMVLAQLNLSPDEAQLIVRGHAYASSRSVMEVAEDVVDGRLRFVRRDGAIEVMR